MKKNQILMKQIDKLLNGLLTYTEFKKYFWSYYLENSSQNDFTKEEDNFFSEIQETFDWTVEKPSDEDRGYGYLDWQQFIRFVKEARDLFLTKGELSLEEAEKIRLSILKKVL